MSTFLRGNDIPMADRMRNSDVELQQEKIIQFVSGKRLRNFVSSQTKIENHEALLGGRIVVVSSAQQKVSNAVATRCTISKVLSVKNHWDEVLAYACCSEISVIIADTKTLRKDILLDKIKSNPPFSFPGKLLAFLFQRYQHFEGAADKGVLILCDKESDTGFEVLESIVLELAHLNGMRPAFLDWIENANCFREMK